MDLKLPISKVISFSWQKTKEILFPFELKRWLKILLIVWLAGHAAGLGGSNHISKQLRSRPKRSERATIQPQARYQIRNKKANLPAIPATSQIASSPSLPDTKKTTIPFLKVVVFLLVPAILGLVLFFLWLNARFNFIFLDLVVCHNTSIGAAFQKYKSQGSSYFKWLILFLSIGFGLSTLLIGGMAFVRPLWWLFVFLVLVFLVAIITFGTLIDDFVLPLMYQNSILFGKAFERFFALKPSVNSIVFYLLVKLGLGIASSLIVLLTGLLLAGGIIAAVLLVVLLGGFLAAFLSFSKPILMAAGFFLLVVGVLGIIVLLGLITLPIPIFFRVFSLAYLGQLVQGYDLLGFSDFSPQGEVSHF